MTPEKILEVEKNIVYALKNIYDPEIPVNIYDLGLIYDIEYTPERVAMIRMTLTAPNCPMADELLAQVESDVATVDDVDSVEITLTFEPAWDREMISEEAMLEMGLM
ncbi:MAG: iron-sulfur cluster assembly protein [Rikenellaceae bacterium]